MVFRACRFQGQIAATFGSTTINDRRKAVRGRNIGTAMHVRHGNRNIVDLHIANCLFSARFEKCACRCRRERSITLAKKQILNSGQLRAPPTAERCKVTAGAFKLADNAEMVLQVLSNTASSCTISNPCGLISSAGPTPLRSKICGELSAPADKITSLLARTVKLLPFF